MSTDPIAFVFGDRDARPRKTYRAVEHIIGDVFSTQGFVALGIFLQSLCTIFVPAPYTLLPGAAFIGAVSLPTLRRILGLASEPAETSVIVGRTTAYLDFADHSHVGKQPGATAVAAEGCERPRRPQLALMIIGSQCHSALGALQPEFKALGDVFAGMIHEFRTAPPEEDVGFLNAEFYMHGANSSNNSNMACLYFRSYGHIIRFAHKEGGAHWPVWNKFRKLQREQVRLGTQIGLWHEIYEVSNATAIYHNMPRIGLGDMWDAVPAPGGGFVYRNALVLPNGAYATSDGRLGYVHAGGAKGDGGGEGGGDGGGEGR